MDEKYGYERVKQPVLYDCTMDHFIILKRSPWNHQPCTRPFHKNDRFFIISFFVFILCILTQALQSDCQLLSLHGEPGRKRPGHVANRQWQLRDTKTRPEGGDGQWNLGHSGNGGVRAHVRSERGITAHVLRAILERQGGHVKNEARCRNGTVV